MAPLPPGATIGILGGGQLGRMLAMAAARLGFRTAIYDPDPQAPAAQVANRTTTADWTDTGALSAFAEGADALTYEFENIPADALAAISGKLRPTARALAVSQDRLDEKRFLEGLGLAVAPHAAVDDAGSLAAAMALTGTPAILKTRRLGYDGKGQARIDGPGGTSRAITTCGSTSTPAPASPAATTCG